LKHEIRTLEGGTLILVPELVYGHDLTYLWTPATYLSSDTAATPVCKPDDEIVYTLHLSGTGGCTVTDTVHLIVLKGPVVPNIFSPNGDGINDVWKIKYLEYYPDATVQVYNRYGQIVYSSVGYGTGWDGTYKGSTLPVGTYYYIINPKNGRPTVSGSVTIIK
jgi:gliding motility-associated-like protein